jgi:hypothetical protein
MSGRPAGETDRDVLERPSRAATFEDGDLAARSDRRERSRAGGPPGETGVDRSRSAHALAATGAHSQSRADGRPESPGSTVDPFGADADSATDGERLRWRGQWPLWAAALLPMVAGVAGAVRFWVGLIASIAVASVAFVGVVRRRLDGDQRLPRPVERLLATAARVDDDYRRRVLAAVDAVAGVPGGRRLLGAFVSLGETAERTVGRTARAVSLVVDGVVRWKVGWSTWDLLVPLYAHKAVGVVAATERTAGRPVGRTGAPVAAGLRRALLGGYGLVDPHVGRFAGWRDARPFWGGLALLASSFVVGLIPVALAVQLALVPGSYKFAGAIFALTIAVCGGGTLFMPRFSSLFGWLGMVVAVLSIVGGALGGFLVGTVLGVVGGALAVAWVEDDADDDGRSTRGLRVAEVS